MVFDEYQCIFFHVPKTAGTSIENWLNYGKRDLSPHNAHIPQLESMFGLHDNVYLQHATASFLRQLVSPTKFRDYYKFSMVRNPYERIRSVYDYSGCPNFERFVLELPEKVAHPANLRGSHFTPQVEFTYIDNQPVCEDVFKFEDLTQVEELLKRKFGLNTSLPRHNVTQRKSTHVFTSQMTDVITSIYRRDFELFGYATIPPS